MAPKGKLWTVPVAVDNRLRPSLTGRIVPAMTQTFATAAAQYILERGPLTLLQLHTLALEQGVTRARSPASLRSSLSGSRTFVERPDGRYDTAVRLLTGALLTTRLRRPPSDGVLWGDRDLDPLLALDRRGTLPLSTGGHVAPGVGHAECWVGPAGWLDAAPDAGLLGLRWDGRVLHVEAVEDAVTADSAHAQEVRRLLARHARGRQHRTYAYDPPPALTTVVLSALLEDPDLLRRPLPPLSELLPLPEDLRPQDSGPSRYEPVNVLRVPVPLRVHDELGRRADLLGERLPDYVGMLLSAAADRLLPPTPVSRRYDPYDTCDAYDQPSAMAADVVELSRWAR